MKSTKFKPILSLTEAYKVLCHRKPRGTVFKTRSYNRKIVEVSREYACVDEGWTEGWGAQAPDGTRTGGVYPTRRLAAIRLLTDHRFSAKV